jgi:hypothetical protein
VSRREFRLTPAINDHRKLEFAGHYEQLVRALLDLPGEPAIINIQ